MGSSVTVPSSTQDYQSYFLFQKKWNQLCRMSPTPKQEALYLGRFSNTNCCVKVGTRRSDYSRDVRGIMGDGWQFYPWHGIRNTFVFWALLSHCICSSWRRDLKVYHQYTRAVRPISTTKVLSLLLSTLSTTSQKFKLFEV